jgi:hypothetical protein
LAIAAVVAIRACRLSARAAGAARGAAGSSSATRDAGAATAATPADTASSILTSAASAGRAVSSTAASGIDASAPAIRQRRDDTEHRACQEQKRHASRDASPNAGLARMGEGSTAGLRGRRTRASRHGAFTWSLCRCCFVVHHPPPP